MHVHRLNPNPNNPEPNYRFPYLNKQIGMWLDSAQTVYAVSALPADSNHIPDEEQMILYRYAIHVVQRGSTFIYVYVYSNEHVVGAELAKINL